MREKDFDHDACEKAIRMLLSAMGEDPDREGLASTPSRVARSWKEMTEGYHQEAREVLKTTDGTNGFSEVGGYDQMIVVTSIPFDSTCEHHMLPFRGIVDVAYVPGKSGRCVGLSKIPRLVDMYGRRLQVQERLTQQIADTIMDHLDPLGVGVRVTAHHQCVSCRGVKKQGVQMVTEALLGAFREHPVRDEFWNLTRARV